jgi:hypothetical protein
MHKIYHWRGVSNFGDRLTPFILDQLGHKHIWAEPGDADLIGAGSIIEHLPDSWPGTIVGAGHLLPRTRTDLTHANVLALRGRLTFNKVDLDRRACPPVLGDPGLLVSQFVRQGPATCELGIVPHWSDTELARRFPHGRVIDVRGPVWEVVAAIASCKRVISSSLHGLVVADAYGIPRQAELFAQAQREGGDFKFRDYQSVYSDPDPHFGRMWRAPYHEVARIQRSLRNVIEYALENPGVPAPTERRRRRCRWRRPQISLLVPFRDDGEHRTRVWNWLRRYWRANLRSVEIVMGHDDGKPFSKAAAVNHAASRARGRIFVILDADAYLDSRVVQECADNLDAARKTGKRLWYMPYNKLYRLSRHATLDLLRTNPVLPYHPPRLSPDHLEVTGQPDGAEHYGHRHGAMVQIMPRQAFFVAGGMDPRMRGWGSEDISFLRALDTLWGCHEVTNNNVVHLWHARPDNDWQNRSWIGQGAQANSRLCQRYTHASGEPALMRGLAEERERPQPRPWWR